MVAMIEHIGEGFEVLDCRALEIAEAHRTLGESCYLQVHKILEKRISSTPRDQLLTEIDRTEGVLFRIHELTSNKLLPAVLRQVLREYLQCLESWSEGCALESFAHQQKTSSLAIALLLQDDNSGCQTGMFRDGDGNIHLWHTEEDMEDAPGDRFDKLRLLQFATPEGVMLTSFIYPDLLPGSAFGWRDDGIVQAADALFLKPSQLPNGMLANVAAWLAFRLGKMLPPEILIRETLPYHDGYAMMLAFIDNLKPSGLRIEFAGGDLTNTPLGSQSGSRLFQVNCFSQAAANLAATYERDPFPTLGEYQKRITRTDTVLNSLMGQTEPSADIATLLDSTEGGAYAYRNQDVKAKLQAMLTTDSIKIRVEKGTQLEAGI